jgi:hypothetical protein
VPAPPPTRRDLRLSLALLGRTWVKKNQEPPSPFLAGGAGRWAAVSVDVRVVEMRAGGSGEGLAGELPAEEGEEPVVGGGERNVAAGRERHRARSGSEPEVG